MIATSKNFTATVPFGVRLALTLLVAAVALLAATPGAGAREVVDAFGTQGTQGGEINNPSRIAVNNSGSGGVAPGTIYVADGSTGSTGTGTNRIQRFAPDGSFQRAWGFNVAGHDERQQLIFSPLTGGSFTLSFGGDSTTLALLTNPGAGSTYFPSAAQMQVALEALPSIGAGNVSIGGGPLSNKSESTFTVRFIGNLGGTDVSQLVADDSSLGGTISVSTIEDGSGGAFAGSEICTVAAECREGLDTPAAANGGQLAGPRDIVVNQGTGDVYVANQGNLRIEQFDADGNFIRAFGWDVVSPGGTGDVPGTDEQQTITLPAGVTGGQYNLSFRTESTGASGRARFTQGSNVVSDVLLDRGAPQIGHHIGAYPSFPEGEGTTVTAVNPGAHTFTASKLSPHTSPYGEPFTTYAIPFDASAATVQSALEGLSTVGAGNVAVSGPAGGPYTVSFQGDLGGTDVPGLNADGGGLAVASGSSEVSVATTTNGIGNFEVCAVAADCKRGANGADGGTVGGPVGGVALDSSGDVWVADAANSRLEEFDSSGNFIAAYGWDVDAAGGSGGLEKCSSSALGACQAAARGNALGQFGNILGERSIGGLAIDSADNLYAVDPGNNRIQKFDPTLSSASAFGAGLPISVGSRVTAALLALPGDHLLLDVWVAAGGERQLLELDSSGAVVGTALASAGVPDINGLARDAGSGRLYATTSNGGSSSDPYGVLILGDGPVAPPSASVDPITIFDDQSATFTGTVDPGGLPLSSCKFQYSTDEANWTDAPATPDCETFDRNGGAGALSADVTGLEPGSHYYVRLIATRPYNPAATATSAEEEVTLPSLPPILSNLGTTRVTDESAYLVGTVQPRSQLTNYRFQYTTTDFSDCETAANPDCHEAPVPPGEIAGSAQRTVVEQVQGLSPDSDYDFKLIADNVAGAAESAVASLHTRATPPPAPEQRAYEQVTPTDKNFVDIATSSSGPRIAQDGQAAAFPIANSLPDPPSQGWAPIDPNVVKRTASGWRVSGAANPPVCANDPQRTDFAFISIPVRDFSANIDRAVIARPEFPNCPIAPLDPTAPPQKNLYIADLGTDPFGYQLITPQPAVGTVGPAYAGAGGTFVGANPDFSHVLYTSTRQMSAEAPAGGFAKLFDYHGGAITLVSKDKANAPFTTDSAIAGAESTHAVSDDGLRIFFQNPTGGNKEIYMRQAGSITYDVSESECTSACGANASDNFLAASPSGAKALFASAAKLNDDDVSSVGQDLYLYTHSANPAVNTNLGLLSKDSEPADGTGADVLGLIGASDALDAVFFAANGQLVPGGPTEAGPKLYRWQNDGGSPTLEYLGTLASADTDNWSGGKIRQVSPDGSALMVQSRAALDQFADADKDLDVYRWREGEGWQCASCQLPSEASAGDATFSGASPDVTGGQLGQFGNAMSADGQRLFFTTPDALLAADANDKRDLYEWNDGTLGLISSGAGKDDVKFAGIGLSGDDVFFLTRRQLVGWDTDDALDLYDARIGGGFPEPPPAETPCPSAEECHGAGPTAPEQVGAGSAVFKGSPNPTGGAGKNNCNRFNKKAKRKLRVAKKAAKQGQAKKARKLRRQSRKLRRQSRNLRRRAKRCNRRATR